MKSRYLYIVATFIFLISCVKPTPQFPANKGNTIDSTSINLQKLNEILALKEDSSIQNLVKKQSIPYKKTSNGIWFHKEIETSQDSLIKKPSIQFSYKCYTLTGEVVNSEKIKLNFGKKEIAVGLEEGIKLMRNGEKMRLIVPWYLAYGMNGKDNIPPYTSLIYEISAE